MSGRRLRRETDEVLVSGGGQPAYGQLEYAATMLRAPQRPLILLPERLADRGSPVAWDVSPREADLTRRHDGLPLGQRIAVAGRVTDVDGRPMREMLIEIWQANASGRYAHEGDRHPAPLDPNFSGAGRVLTDADGGYRFVTIRPGSYPWRTQPNAWRPAHIHLSLLGRELSSRLVTQMYFPDDPLLAADPIFQSVRNPDARDALIARFDWQTATTEMLGFRFDIVVGGSAAAAAETG
jgi:protocatechuate 3,4-dioxygenase beta subunit